MIIFLATILYMSGYFIPIENNYIYGIVAELIMCVLFYSSFAKTPYSSSMEVSGWFCLLLWSLVNVVFFTWFQSPLFINYAIGFIELVVFVTFFLYSQYRSYDIPSDVYNNKDSYIVFKRPETLLGFLFGCIFSPVSSVAVVTQGFLYSYKMGKLFDQYNYIKKDNHILIKINKTPDEIRDKMESMIKTEWTFKTNCCHVAQQIFPEIKFKEIRDRLPCYFINTIIKNKAIK